MFEVFFSLLDDPAFQREVKHNIRNVGVNYKIIEQGKEHNNIYLIKSGQVKVVITKNKVAHPGINLNSHDIFGEFGLLDDTPASADVIAITRCELIEIDIISLRQFLEKKPELGYLILKEIVQTLTERLRHADKAMASLYAWGLKSHEIDKDLK